MLAAHPAPALVALGLIAALIAWLRLPAVARDTFWAEDGRTFVSSAAMYGPATLVVPYEGYLHTVPRFIAGVVAFLPVPVWAQATTAGACLVAGGLAVVVFVCARDLIPWLPARLFVAGLTVLAPLAPREVLGNLTNLHSLFLWTLFWIVLSRPRKRAESVSLGAIAFLGAVTEIQALFLTPLLFLRCRDRSTRIVRAGLAAGILIQLIVTVTWPRPRNTNPAVPPLSIGYGYLINAVMPLAVPQERIGPVLAVTGPTVGLLVLGVMLAATVVILRRGERTQRTLVIAALSASVLVYAAGVAANPDALYDYAQHTPAQLQRVWLSRYGVVPSMLLAAIPALAGAIAVRSHVTVAGATRPRWSLTRTVPMLIAAAASCLLIVGQTGPQDTRRTGGPTWQPQIAAAAEQCESDDDGAVMLRETIGWHVRVPCRVLTTSDVNAHDSQ